MAEVYVEPFTGSFAATYREENKLPFVVWRNLLTRSNITVSSTSSQTSAANLVEENTIDFWRPSSSGNCWIRASGLSNVAFNTVVIRGHNLYSISATVRVRVGSTTVAIYAPKSNGVVVITFPEVSDVTQITMDIETNGTALVGTVLFGNKMVFRSGIDGSGFRPIEFSTVTELMTNKTQTGQLLSNRVIRRGISADLPINPVEDAFVGTRFRNFVQHYNDGRPFAFASSPTYAPSDAGWFWRPATASDLEINSIANGMYTEFSIPVEGAYS